MDEKIKQDFLDITSLENKYKNLTKNIIDESSLDNVKKLLDEFNLNQTKKNAVRVIKYSALLDKVSDEMIERFNHNPDEFTNGELLQYLQGIQTALDKSNKALNNISDISQVTINQINIKKEEPLDRDSRRRIDNAVKAIFKLLNENTVLNNDEQTVQDDEIIDIEKESENTENETDI